MKIRKRYILLILIALLPIYKFIHLDDYCFGDEDLVVVSAFVVLFFIAFIVILFDNLYSISVQKELFNFRPIIIAVFYGLGFFLFLKYHEKNVLKNSGGVYNIRSAERKLVQVTIFTDNTFEVKKEGINESCFNRGSYKIKKDTLFLSFNKKDNYPTDTIYQLNKKEKLLFPLNK